ncbi:hypothetical protein SALB_00578 [Streptomyces noursei]|uniref:Uncharacterized protein n=1 Tax=Streptomyces noursei TaxID=1971 RepID=A0A401QR60_STRNR|nr:hypothetical protein SALB_00578 [Streptomyces noursei]
MRPQGLHSESELRARGRAHLAEPGSLPPGVRLDLWRSELVQAQAGFRLARDGYLGGYAFTRIVLFEVLLASTLDEGEAHKLGDGEWLGRAVEHPTREGSGRARRMHEVLKEGISCGAEPSRYGPPGRSVPFGT